MMQDLCPGLDMYCTDPAQHHLTADIRIAIHNISVDDLSGDYLYVDYLSVDDISVN